MNELVKLKDSQLLEKFSVLVRQEREIVSEVIVHLSEIDRRKLYAGEGYSSLFSYCVEKYHYSESEAFLRIQASRLSQSFPEVLKLLREGRLTLTTLKMISPYLTQENKNVVFEKIQQKSKRDIEQVLADLFPQEEEILDSIRNLPLPKEVQSAQNLTRSGTSTLSKIRAKGVVKPITSQRVKIELSASESLAKKIQRAKELLKHKYPEGKLEDILNEALELFLEKKDPERKILKQEKKEILRTEPAPAKEGGSQNATQNKTRYIPQEMKLQVWKRDEGQCRYESSAGRRCEERAGLELDHIEPFALGGNSTPENLRLLCRVHNQWRAEKTFGKNFSAFSF